MERTLIAEAPGFVGKIVELSGWISVRRDHGKLIFIDLRDRSGVIQAVVIPDKEEAYKIAKDIRSEYAVRLKGVIKERPGKAANEKLATGKVEMEVEEIEVIAQPAEELPVDVSDPEFNLNLETLLDYRTVTLRNEKVQSIFKIYAEILKAYAESMRQAGFLEIKTPKIVSSATEGGANFFKIKYFEREAYLAQSPQFYKQAAAGVFERVFEIGSVFRAEPHFTTRHVNEYVGLDGEMAFIESFDDVMDELEKSIKYVLESVAQNCRTELEKYGAEIPKFVPIPRIKLTEAAGILDNEFGKKIENLDIDAEGERLIGEWAKKEHSSDLVFLTHYPYKLRPFYSQPSADPEYTETFDLIYRGVEIASGGQRINDFQELLKNIKKRKLKPEQFKDYLDIFKYGIPPHGGWGLGSERIVQKILGLGSVKEAILFPRDVKRLTP